MTLRTNSLGAAKKAKQTHWWRYDGSYRVACGKQYSQGEQPLLSTVNIACVTCKACLRVHKRATAQRGQLVNQVMSFVSR